MSIDLHFSERWSVWSWAALRSAGFVAADITRLASSDVAGAADHYLERARALAACRESAIDTCAALLSSLDAEQRRSCVALLKKLRAGGVPPVGPLAREALEALLAADNSLRQAREVLEKTFAEGTRAVGAAIRELAGNNRVREALVWQNRSALKTGILPLLETPAGATDKQTRKREQTAARYLQRYHLKNDRIGFFGPLAWARIVPEPHVLRFEASEPWLKKRTVFFEYWSIDALASRLAEDAALLPYLAPRVLPTIRIDGDRVHHSIDQVSELPPIFARALQLIDGTTRAIDLAAVLCADTSLGLADADEAYSVFQELVDRKLISWTLEIPTAGNRPEAYLRGLLDRVDDLDAKNRALAVLDALEEKRDAVARAAGDPLAIDTALAALEETFEAATQTAATRHGGQTYAGRTLVYEECRRNVSVTLGSAFLEKLAPPLSLVLESARWFTYEIASAYDKVLRELYSTLAAELGSPVIEFSRFWQGVEPLFPGAKAEDSIIRRVGAELQQRWSRVLGLENIGPDERRVQRAASALAGTVSTTFAAPRPGWPAARHHSPDLMIASPSAEAFSRGEFLIVLGEVHVALNTVTNPVIALEHPNPEILIAQRELDLPDSQIAPVWSKARTRADFYSLSRHDFDLEVADTRSPRSRDRVLAESALVVELIDGRFVVRTRDGQHRFDMISFLEQHLIADSHGQFHVMPPRPHSPRVTIDQVVIAREQWRPPLDQLSFKDEESSLERFIAARDWARKTGLPRHVFFKVPEEPKPLYLDFYSPVLVDNFAKIVRQASSVVISEMLPAIDEAWLEDSNGRRYTSELRIAAVDHQSARVFPHGE